MAQRTDAPLAAATGAVVAAFFAPAIAADTVPLFRDFVNVFLPWKLYAAAAVRSGRLPLWSPELGLGAPFLASYQGELLYPPSAIVYGMPDATGIGLYLALHFWLGAFGTSRLLARRGLRPTACLLGGITYAFGGVFVSFAPWGHLVVAAWLPFAIVAVEDLARAPSARRVLALSGIVALELLAGAPESFLQSAALTVAAAALVRGGVPPGRRMVLVATSFALGGALAAAQLLPTLELVGESERAGGLGADVAMLFSVEPASLGTLVSPHRLDGGILAPFPEREFPLLWSIYVGLVPLVLAIFGAASRRSLWWTLALLASVELALGRHGTLLPLLHRSLPALVDLFRFPSKLLLVAHLSAAVLAAIGLDRLRGLAPRLSSAGLGLAVCVVAIVDLWSVHRPAMLFDGWQKLVRSAPPAVLGGIGPSTRIFHYERGAAGLRPWNPKFQVGDDLRTFERRVWADLGASVGLVYGAGVVADVSGLRRRRIGVLLDALGREPSDRGLRILRALGVGFLVGEEPLPASGLECLREGEADTPGRAWIYRLDRPEPRVSVAQRVRSAPDAGAALESLAGAPAGDAVVEGECPPLLDCSGEEAVAASARLVVDSPGRLEVAVEAGEPALLVVADSWFPGWVGEVDGDERAVVPVNGVVRGIVVPAGAHRVALRYEPRAFRAGLAISLAALVAAAPIAAWIARSRGGSR